MTTVSANRETGNQYTAEKVEELRISDLHAFYGEGHALHGIDLSVYRGELVTLLGRNGSGRTTTLRSIVGLIGKRTGSIMLKGQEVIDKPPHVIAHLGIGYCPEERGIFSSLNVEENLMLPPMLAGGGMTVDEIYTMFPNLKERRKSQGTRLSGGEQQMLALARILRTGATFLLLDEITEGLAPVIVDTLGDVLMTLKERGYTVILVEQNFRFAAPIADRHLIMDHGHIVETVGQGRDRCEASRLRRISERLKLTKSGDKTMRNLTKIALTAVSALALSTAPASAKGISDDVVKIGLLTDMSGTYSDLAGAGAVAAAEMAIEDFGSKVAGAPIELLTADHQNKADIAANKAREWGDEQQVDAFAELVTTSVALAVFEIAKQQNKIALVSGAASSPLTNDACIPTGIHYTYNTRALANGTGAAVVAEGGDSWYFLTADYAFGQSLEKDVTEVVKDAGGEVLGSIRHPFPTSDFSSFVLQAQASGAKVIGLANAGADTTNAIKAANEFGLVAAGQSLAALLMFITDVDALGLDTAQGIQLTTGFLLGSER